MRGPPPREYVGCDHLNRLTRFLMLLERATLLSCYETGNRRGNESWLGDLNEYKPFPASQLGDMLLEYKPSFGLDLSLLPDGVLGKGLVGGRECRVVMNFRVPFCVNSKSTVGVSRA